MQVTASRWTENHVIYAHSWNNRIVSVKSGILADAFNDQKFCDILYVNFLREIAANFSATVDVQILESGIVNGHEADLKISSYITVLKPVWQHQPFDAEYDRMFNKHVTCVETGEVYSSGNAAADTLGLSPGNLYHALRFPGARKTLAGKRWVRTAMPVTVR